MTILCMGLSPGGRAPNVSMVLNLDNGSKVGGYHRFTRSPSSRQREKFSLQEKTFQTHVAKHVEQPRNHEFLFFLCCEPEPPALAVKCDNQDAVSIPRQLQAAIGSKVVILKLRSTLLSGLP